jgi:DNA processing protein
VLKTAWVALSLTGRIGRKTLDALLARFDDDPQAIVAADVKALQCVPGVGPKIARSIQAINLEQTGKDIERWQKAGVRIVTRDDDAYPTRLSHLDDAPPTLFMRGGWKPAFDRAVAVVGTRRPSREAAGVARRLAAILAQRGYTIVSGLATGIDTNAHHSALASRGSSVAVLGCGVLNVYPEHNRLLADRIIEQGALLCEVHPQASPNAASLVARNRIISGLSEAVIVVETGADGGAMHAARFAFEQGRRVYAVDKHATGNRALIENGAIAVPPDWDGADLP